MCVGVFGLGVELVEVFGLGLGVFSMFELCTRV